MIPIIIKHAVDEHVENMREMAREQLKAEKNIPSYKEMRAAKIHPDMSDKERWAYRGNKVQQGYLAGTIGGGLTGGIIGHGIGSLLGKTKFGRSMPGATHAIKKWILPSTIGYTGYRLGSIEGRKAGERIARKKLNESGNTIPYVNPISLTDRGASDPVFMGTMMSAKTMQSILSEKGREKVETLATKVAPHGERVRDLFKVDMATIGDKLKNIKIPRLK